MTDRSVLGYRFFAALFWAFLVVLFFSGHPAAAQAPTATPVEGWIGRIVNVTEDLSLRGSVLRVSVVGQKDLPVEVSTADGTWSVTGLTGTKSEFGEYMVEFAALARGDYVIKPLGLGTSLPFHSDTKSYVTVEFKKEPLPTGTPAPSSTPTLIPTPSPTQTATWTPVLLIPTATPRTTQTPTWTPVAPGGTSTPLPTAVVTGEPTQIVRTVWSGRIVYKTPGSAQSPGTIVVRVLGERGLPVALELDGLQIQSETGTKPEYGGFACEFGALTPGEYRVKPQGLDSTVSVSLDRGEFVLVEFMPLVVVGASTSVPDASPTATVALVVSTAVVQPSAVSAVTSELTPTVTLEAGANLLSPGAVNPSFRVLRPLRGPTWTARVTQRTAGAPNSPATLVVSVLGARDLPVWLKADGWRSSALTGTKLEYGDFACEFGGLPAGKYGVNPDGMDLTYDVSIDPGEFVVVEFTYTVPELPVIPELAIPLEGSGGDKSWSGRVVSRSVDSEMPAEWGSVLVEVWDLEGLPVEILSADGWSAFKLTEARTGSEGFVAEFVRLAPGTYQVVPQGLGSWIELAVDGGSLSRIEFASR